MTDRPDTYVGLDLGGAQTRCLIASRKNSRLVFHSCGSMPSLRWDDEEDSERQMTVDAVREALHEAEQDGDLTIVSAVVGIAGAHVRSSLVHTAVRLAPNPGVVRLEDVGAAVRKAEHGLLSTTATALQLVPLEFSTDSQSGLRNPIGRPAMMLEAYVRVVSTLAEEHERAREFVNRASVQVEETILAGFASAYSTLQQAERANGVAHLEIGKTSSSLTAYCEAGLRLASGLPVGRDHLVGDVARAFTTEPSAASSLISDFGAAVYSDGPSGAYVAVPSNQPRYRAEVGRLWPRDTLDKIIALRVEECLELARDELRREGLYNGAVRSLVLSGDIAGLPGIGQTAQSILGLRTRIGVPCQPENLPEPLQHPGWACAAGLVMYAHRLAYQPPGGYDHNEMLAAMRNEEEKT